MKTRYDFMNEGTVKDTQNDSYYPDPLTLNYLMFQLVDLPKKDILTSEKIIKLWHEAEIIYGSAQWDDIVLTLNGISHKNFLKNDDELLFPSEDDIVNSFTKTS